MVQPQNTFSQLVEEARQGNEAAARQIISEYQPYIIRTIRRNMAEEIRRKFDSQDFVQAVWASFFRHRDGIFEANEPAQLARFLAAMAKNKLLDELRRRYQTQKYNVNRERPLDEYSEGKSRRHMESPSQYAVAVESWERLIDGLSTRDRAIAELRIAGETQASIANQLGIGERTVSRVLERLEKRHDEVIH